MKKKNGGSFVTPDRLKEIFDSLPEKAKKRGIEVPIYGFSMSTKSFLFYLSDPSYITQLANKSLKENGGLMNDLFVTQKYYPQHLSFFDFKMHEDKKLTERYGVPFHLVHNDANVFIEPNNQTEVIGFNEIFTKRAYSNWEILNNQTNKSYSQDPWICHNLSTSIVFEGNYMTAFGLVTMNSVTGKFRMTKPLALVSGGIKNLMMYLKRKSRKYLGKSFMWFLFGMIMTSVLAVSVNIMIQKYKTI